MAKATTSKGADKKRTCRTCGKKLSRHSLSRHMKLHDPNRKALEICCPYPNCPRSMLQYSNLKTHIRTIHEPLGETLPCADPECTSTFVDPAALSKHEKRTHGFSRQLLKYRERERAKKTSMSRAQAGPSTAADQDDIIPITPNLVVPSQSPAPSPPMQNPTPLSYPLFSYTLAPPEVRLRGSSAPPSTSYITTATLPFPSPYIGPGAYSFDTTSTQSTPNFVSNLNNAGGAWSYSYSSVTPTHNLIAGPSYRSDGYLGVSGQGIGLEHTPLLSPPLSDLGSGSDISPSYSPYSPASNLGLGLGLENLQISPPPYPESSTNFQVAPIETGNPQVPVVQDEGYFGSPDYFDPPAVPYDHSEASHPIYFADLFGDQYSNYEM